MRERALIHVAGPKRAGKTELIERVLESAGEMILAARCVWDDRLRQAQETAPKAHPELRRYRHAGATGAALFAFPGNDIGSDAFFVTRLMEDYSKAVLLEGDNPLGFVDLAAFVAPPPPAGESFLVRRKRDRTQEAREKAEAIDRLLRGSGGGAELLGQMFGGPARRNPELEEKRIEMLAEIMLARKARAPEPAEHWVIGSGYEGIERAQLVVVNVRTAVDRGRGESLVAEVHRLRKDEAVFDDVLGFRGSKIPVTAVVANLADPRDPGTKKAVARVRRALRARS